MQLFRPIVDAVPVLCHRSYNNAAMHICKVRLSIPLEFLVSSKIFTRILREAAQVEKNVNNADIVCISPVHQIDQVLKTAGNKPYRCVHTEHVKFRPPKIILHIVKKSLVFKISVLSKNTFRSSYNSPNHNNLLESWCCSKLLLKVLTAFFTLVWIPKYL